MELPQFTQTVLPLREDLLLAAKRMCRDDDMCEDLVQDVMLKLWSMRQSLDHHPNIRALALTILRNRYTDYWRRKQVLRQRDGTYDLAATELSVEQRDQMSLIQLIVDHLPPLQSQIFRLKEIEGYERDEIIAITGCSEESLRSNLSRARRRIREEFLKMSQVRLSQPTNDHSL